MKGFLVVTYRDVFQQETTRQYELEEEVGLTPAEELGGLWQSAQAILSAIVPLTGAQIVATALSVVDTGFSYSNSGKPEAGSNISDDGVLSVALNSGGKGTLRIPSPLVAKVDAVGSPDIDNDWIEFVGVFSPDGGGMLSDGEYVDTSQGTGGILKTWRASRGRRNN